MLRVNLKDRTIRIKRGRLLAETLDRLFAWDQAWKDWIKRAIVIGLLCAVQWSPQGYDNDRCTTKGFIYGTVAITCITCSTPTQTVTSCCDDKYGECATSVSEREDRRYGPFIPAWQGPWF